MKAKLKPGTPHRSLSHDERFYHIKDPSFTGTVFLRDEFGNGQWLGAVAICHEKDSFNRMIGRNLARRRYFQSRNTDSKLLASANDGSFESALAVAKALLPRVHKGLPCLP